MNRRGYLIELGVVGSGLLAHPAVIESAVVAVSDELAPTPSGLHFKRLQNWGAELLRFCDERLP